MPTQYDMEFALLEAKIDGVALRISTEFAGLTARIGALEKKFTKKFTVLYWMTACLLMLDIGILARLISLGHTFAHH